MTVLDQLLHLTEEEGQHQRGDMATVHVGIGHNDNLIVAQFVEVQGLVILLGANRHTQCDKHILDLLVLPHLVLLSLLDVQDLTTQRHNSLELAVATLLCGTTCRITLDEENLGNRAVAARTVSQLTRQTRTRQGSLALYQLTRVTCGVARRSCQNHLLHNRSCILRVLLQILRQSQRNSCINRCNHLAVTQLGLGLTLELGLGNLYRNNGSQALAEVVTIDIELQLCQHTRLIGILLQSTGQCAAEAGQMGTTLDGVDIVYIRMYILRERVVVLHCNLYGHAIALGVDIDHRLDQRLTACCVEILNKLLQTVVREEGFATEFAILVLLAAVGEDQLNALVQVSQLAQTCCQNIVLILGRNEDVAIGLEGHDCTRRIDLTHNLHRRSGSTLAVRLTIDLTIAMYLSDQFHRKGIHARYTYTVQTTRYFITVLIEFTAGVQHRQHDFESRLALLLVHIGGDTSTVILYGDRVVLVDGYLDVGAITRQSLVDRVIDNLINQVVQTLFAHITNIHCGSFAYCFKTFQHLNTGSRILLLGVLLYVFQIVVHC